MKNSAPIGLIDSGIGGFTVLQELQRRLPHENYLYYGDSLRMPYGERKNDELIRLANSIIKDLEKRGVKIVVLACNTLSSLIMEFKANVPLFSVIEAGVAETLTLRDKGLVGLIATTATVKNKGYDKEMALCSRELKFISQGTQTLGKAINGGKKDLINLKHNISEAVEPILLRAFKEGVEIEELLLGCTHFPIVSGTISEMYPELYQINPANGLVRMMKRHLTEFGAYNPQKTQGLTRILTTSDYDVFERMIEKLDLNCEELKITKLKMIEDNLGSGIG